jgi:polyisoprenoid-binding protein YceI
MPARPAPSPYRMRVFVSLVIVGAFSAGSSRLLAEDDAGSRYAVDQKAGSLTLEVKKKGALKAFAHDHDMAARVYTGTVVWVPGAPERSSVSIRITTKDIVVLDKELSDKDRAQVQATMESSEVLDVKRYPEITFVSESVAARAKRPEGGIPLAVTGKLTLHGSTRQRTLEVVLEEKDGKIEVSGDHAILQTDFGIEPSSMAFGAVGVEDKVTIKLRIVAEREGGAARGEK